jgi:hypothetical protein
MLLVLGNLAEFERELHPRRAAIAVSHDSTSDR